MLPNFATINSHFFPTKSLSYSKQSFVRFFPRCCHLLSGFLRQLPKYFKLDFEIPNPKSKTTDYLTHTQPQVFPTL